MNKPLDDQYFSLNLAATLTGQQQAEIAALQAMPDEAIDYSDIPPLTEEFWQNAVRNPFYNPSKTTTTVRVDTDVLLWLKSKGKGYQNQMNAILRAEMLKELEQLHH
ncbi:MAG: BrnA antitoxin family protein [Methylococcales bacterium]|nr:BrnA antitoxin family protein [Methylococcales bacterium]